MTDKNLTEPNIFEFATKELSQDAFLCWLISWADEKYKETNEELHNFAIKFINKLVGRNDLVFNKVEKQVLNIDILLTLKNKTGEDFIVIIEDKTTTYDHVEQLKRYKEIIDWIENKNNIYLVYIQTGWESQIEHDYLKVWGLEDVYSFFESHPNHYLINQWFMTFKEKYYTIKECKKLFKEKKYKQSFEMNAGCFLSSLTSSIVNETNYKKSYWHKALPSKPIHICLYEKYTSAIDGYSIHHGIYLMFTEDSFKFVVKQHLFEAGIDCKETFMGQKNNGIRKMSFIADNELPSKVKEAKKVLRDKVLESKNWEDKSNENKVIIVQKVCDYSDDFIEKILEESKSIDKLIEIIKST